MNQVLHIFRKDSRRFWPEILVSLVVLVAFTLVTWRLWLPEYAMRTSALRQMGSILELLLPVSWFLLLARVVHAEALVGENEAWLTRPYDWGKLLAAKALFCAAYLYAPLLVAQCVLLWLAGFAASPFLGGLAYRLCLISAFVVLPLFAIAVVTHNFARMTLTLLGVLIAALGLLLLGVWRRHNAIQLSFTDRHPGLAAGALLVLLVAAVVLQYARRPTWATRALLLGPVLVVGLAVALHRGHPNVEAAYPVADAASQPVKMTVNAEGLKRLNAYESGQHDGMVDVSIPVEVAGVPEGYATQLDLVKVSLDAPGVHWDSDWQEQFRRFVPGVWSSRLNIRVDREVYRQVRGRGVDLHIALAVSRLQADSTSQTTMVRGEFPVPENGICAVTPNSGHESLHCRYPLRVPRLTYESANVLPGACGEVPTTDLRPLLTDSWGAGMFGGQGLTPGLSPVSTSEHIFGLHTDNPKRYEEAYWFCQGTTLTSTQYRFAGRTRGTFEVKGLVLPARMPG